MAIQAKRVSFVVCTGRRMGKTAMQEWAEEHLRQSMQRNSIEGECVDVTHLPQLPDLSTETNKLSTGDGNER